MRNSERLVERFRQSIDNSIATIDFNVVVMGPGLNEKTKPAELRRRLIDAAREYGTTVQPEHRGLHEESKQRLKDGYHLTALEIHLVEVSDLIVLIPDSAGALCELGFFGSQDFSARKMIILVNDRYPKSGSYVADGPLIQAKNKGAQVEFVDYDSFERCWSIVESRIQKSRTEKSLSELIGR